jgi:hypothetical protein
MHERWKKAAFGLALLAVAAAATWVLVVRPPLGGVGELLAGGSERQLREPMRTARGGARVLVFAFDGVGDEELLSGLRRGAMPRLAAAIGMSDTGEFEHAFAVPGVLSILPSTTIAAWASLFTGQPPARTGVPGNEWFAREERRFYAPAPVSIEDMDDLLAVYTDDALGAVLRVPTIYEHADVRSYVAMSQVYRGADLLVVPDIRVLGDLAAAGVEGLVGPDDDVEQEAYGQLDSSSADRLLEALREHGLPDLQVVYFPGVDLYTHVAEDALSDQLRFMSEVLDDAAGSIIDAYADAGVLSHTFIVLVSDHGHTPVLGDDRHALGTDVENDPPALLEHAGFRVRPFRLHLDDDQQDFSATLAYQGAMAYLYLADRSTCPRPGIPCDWSRAPRLDEDVMPVVRAFDAANRTGAVVPALRGTLDLIFAREPRAPGQDALPFQVWDGERLVPIPEYLRSNPRPELLDLERRMADLAAGPYGHRAGDVLLLARSGTERPIEDRYYFSAKYRSWHGSPAAQDSRIPLVVAHGGRSAREIEALVSEVVGSSVSQLDVMRLVLALLAME